jgi:hypothetical protein
MKLAFSFLQVLYFVVLITHCTVTKPACDEKKGVMAASSHLVYKCVQPIDGGDK